MKKLFSLLFVALLATTAWAQTVVTIDFTAQGYENAQDVTTLTQDGITLTFDQGSNTSSSPKYYTTGTAVRLYGGNTMNIASDGANITSVVFNFASTSNTMNNPSVDTGSYSETGATGTWTGDAQNFTITRGGTRGHARVQSIEVTIGGAVQTTVDAPVFSPVSGTSFQESLEVALSCATAGADIYYSTDGEQFSLYTAPFTITETTTVSAYATKDGVQSETATATYTKDSGDGPIVFDASVDGIENTVRGEYTVTKNGVSFTSSDGTVTSNTFRFYKSSTLTFNSTVGNITKIEFNCPSSYTAAGFGATDGLDNATGVWTGNTDSFTFTVNEAQVRATTITVTIDGEIITTVSMPEFTPASGTSFDESLEVSLACVTTDAEIYYAVDDAVPALYSAPFTINETCTVSAYAIKNGVQSETAYATYTKNEVVTGEPIVFDHTVDTGDATSEAGPYSVTKDGVTFTVSNGLLGTEAYRIYKGETITFNSTVGNIIKVEFTCTASGAAKYGPGSFGEPSQGEYAYNEYVGTWQGQTTSFSIPATANQVRASEIRVYVDGKVPAIIVAAPVFEPGNNTRFAGTQEVTISCETEGATIYYSTDNENFVEYTGAITLTETTTLYAYAQVGDVQGPKASATYTKLTEVSTIAQANALADKTYFTFVPDGVVVVYQNGANTWIRDNSGYGLIYGNQVPALEQGTLLSDGWDAQKTTYNGIPEFQYPNNVSDSGDDKVTVEPVEFDAADLTVGEVNQYLLFKNQTLALSTADANGRTWLNPDSLKFYNQFQLDLSAIEDGKAYDVVGIVTIYKGAPEVYIVSATEVVEPAGMRGDVNGDENVDPADIAALINYLLNGTECNLDNADCNQDGNVDPADIASLINFLLGGNVWPE